MPAALFLLASCSGKNNQNANETGQEKADDKKAEIIQIDPRTFEENKLTLADFAADIEYVPLSNKLQIGSVQALQVTSNAAYLIYDNSGGGEGNGHPQLYRFERNGKNPIQIGKIGRGPGEYLTSSNYTVDEANDRIYINGKSKYVMVFNTSGKYLREFKFQDPDINFSEIELMQNSYLFAPVNRLIDQTYHIWSIIDTMGNVVSKKENSLTDSKINIGGREGTFKYKDKVSYWTNYNDTIYTVSPDFSYKTPYIIAPGDYKVPPKNMPITLDLPILLTEYYSPHYFIETNKYIISEYNYKKKDAYMFIDKLSHKISVCYFKWNRDEKGGILNNFDGGLMFEPDTYLVQDNKEYLVGIIQPFELKAHVASSEFKNSTPKYPEKKKQLEQLANSLDENDNPVLMLVKLKE